MEYGHDRIRVSSGDGRFEIDPHGARICGLYPGNGLPNVLWAGETMPFPGGDRLWPAPEDEVFGDPTDPEVWTVPPDIDPGTWSMSLEGHDVVLEQTARGTRFSRTVRGAGPAASDGTLAVACYETVDRIEGPSGWTPWHLVMVPAPASVFVHATAEPVEYFPPAPSARDGWYEASGAHPRWKLGWAPPSDGRAFLAAVGSDDPGPLVVVLGAVRPDGTYLDRAPSGGPGTAIQLFDAGGEGFCELEHHAAVGESELRATVIGAWGRLDDRLRYVERLLGGR